MSMVTDADAMGRIVVNSFVFGLVGATSLRSNDIRSISKQRALKR